MNFDVPIFQYCKFIREVWNDTEGEKPKDKCSHREKLVRTYIIKIINGASDLLAYCLPLTSGIRNMMLDDFYREMKNITSDSVSGEDVPLKGCYKLFLSDYDKLLFYEANEKRGNCKYISNGQTAYRETTVNGQLMDYVEASPIFPNYALLAYCKYRGTYEYRLMHRLCDFISTKCRMGRWAQELLAKLLLTVYLYTALGNEHHELIEYASIFIDSSNKAQQPAAPEQRQEEAEATPKRGGLPPKLDTDEAKALLKRVIDAGYCDENYNWDSSKWGEDEDILALVCFAYKASRYLRLIKTKRRNKSQTSWKPFDTLFTYRNKDKRTNGKTQLQIVATNWMQKTKSDRFEPPKNIERKIVALLPPRLPSTKWLALMLAFFVSL